MVFQKATPFPMSIFDNVAFGLRRRDALPTASSLTGGGALREAAMWKRSRTS